MSSSTPQKRQRTSLDTDELSFAESIRVVLATRVAGDGPLYPHLSAHDAALIHLGRSVTDALRVVAENIELACDELHTTRLAIHASIDTRCDELERRIRDAGAVKNAALERELIAVDAALERWRSDSAIVREAVAGLPDVALVAQHTALLARLDGAEAQVLALPTAVIEHPMVSLRTDIPGLLSNIACFGRVFAPLSVTAADLSLVSEGIPLRLQAGGTLRLRLSLGARHANQCPDELEASLSKLIGVCRLSITLQPEVAAANADVTFSHDIIHRTSLLISVSTSSSCPPCIDHIRVNALCIAGQHVDVLGFPLVVPVVRGIQIGLRLEAEVQPLLVSAPSISREGHLYVPGRHGTGKASVVRVYDTDGSALPDVPIPGLGLWGGPCWTAHAYDGDEPLLLATISDYDGTCRLLAVNSTTHEVRWTTARGTMAPGEGVAALPTQGLVITLSNRGKTLSTHRLSDGTRVGSTVALDLDCSLAADAAAGVVFGTTFVCSPSAVDGCVIHAWSWDRQSVSGFCLQDRQFPSDNTFARCHHPLTVVPPSHIDGSSYLIAGQHMDGVSQLFVFSLPGLVLVHKHTLMEMQVIALAADSCSGERLSPSVTLCRLLFTF